MELEAENWRLCSATLVRGVLGELEAENCDKWCMISGVRTVVYDEWCMMSGV